jgi:hypothetical protein
MMIMMPTQMKSGSQMNNVTNAQWMSMTPMSFRTMRTMVRSPANDMPDDEFIVVRGGVTLLGLLSSLSSPRPN